MREPTLSVKVGHVFLFREHDLYGAPGGPRQEDRVGLHLPAHDLCPESAAALGGDGPYLELSVEDMEEGDLVQVRGLGGPPDGHVVGLPPKLATAPTDSGGRALGMFSYPKVPSVMTSASVNPFSTSPLTTPLRQLRP